MKKCILAIGLTLCCLTVKSQNYYLYYGSNVSNNNAGCNGGIQSVDLYWSIETSCTVLPYNSETKCSTNSCSYSLSSKTGYLVGNGHVLNCGNPPTNVDFTYNVAVDISKLVYGVKYACSASTQYSILCYNYSTHATGSIWVGISPPRPTYINVRSPVSGYAYDEPYVVVGESMILLTDKPAGSYSSQVDYSFNGTTWTSVSNPGSFVIPETSYSYIYFRSRTVSTNNPPPTCYSPYYYRSSVEVRKFPNVNVSASPGLCSNSQGKATITISGLSTSDGIFVYVDDIQQAYCQNVSIADIPLNAGNHTLTLHYCIGNNRTKYASKNYPNFNVPKGSITPPTITSNPSSVTVCEGGGANFTVAAAGTNTVTYPFSYTWKCNGNPVGANLPTLYLSNVKTSNAGSYTVNISNTCGSATSNSATLTVNPLPTNTYTLSDPAICNGQQATIIQNGSQTGVNYQLQLTANSTNVGIPIAGSSGSGISYTISPTASTTYKVVATTNTTPACSLTLTDQATVTVNQAPTATAGGPNTVCQSATPSPITLSGASFGGGASNATWSIVSGGGTLSSTAYTSTPAAVTYTPAANFSGTVTLRLTTNFPENCSPAVSERVITISPTSVGGAVTANQTICTGSVPLDLSLEDNTGDVVKWQKSSDIGFSLSTDIVGNSTALSGSSIGSLTSQTYLRAVVKSGVCSEVYSQPATIFISPTSIGGIVSGNQTICYNDKPSDITLTGNRGFVNWQSSLDKEFSTTTEVGGNSTTLKGDDVLFDTTFYRAVVRSGVCPPDTSNWVVVNVNPIITAKVDISADKTKICDGSSVIFNATPNYGWLNPTYEWLVNGSPVGTNSPSFTSSALTNNDAVMVKMTPNGVSCLQEPSVVSNGITMTVNPLPAAIVGTSRSICFGSSTTLGAAAVSGSTYSWSSNPAGFTSTQSNPTVSPTVPTTYTLVENITATGCSRSNSVTITVNPKPTLGTPALTHNECFSGNAGQITISASGGTPTYSYTLAGGGNTPVTTADGVFKNLPAASNYSVTVTDNNGCNDTRGGITLTQPTTPFTLTVTSSQSITCPGGNNGSVVLEVAGGAPGYQFSKDGSTWVSLVSPYRFDNLVFSGKPFSVRDSKGCVVNATNPVIQPLPITPIAAITNDTCKGDSNGKLSIAVSGGTGLYSLGLTGPNLYSNTFSGVATNADFSGLPVGRYTLTVTDSRNCVLDGLKYDILEPATPLSFTTTPQNPLCNGYTDGEIRVTPSGGWGKNSYSFAKLHNGSTYTNGKFSGLGEGTYTISLTDSLGCTLSKSLSLDDPDPLVISSKGINNLKCKGDGTGAIEVHGVGGTPNYSYTLTGGNLITPRSNADGSFTNLPAASDYSILLTDNNNCTTTTFPLVVTEPDSLKILISNRGSNGHTISCPGKMDTVWVKPVGGTSPFTLTPKVESSVSYYPKGFALYDQPNGQYIFTITDANMCAKADTAVISNLPGPKIKLISVDNAICSYSRDGRIEIEPSSVTGTVNVSWLGYSNTGSVFDGLLGGSYTARVTDLYGCTHDTTIAVGKPNPIAVNLLKKADPICFGNADGMLRVSASGGNIGKYTYLWSNGSQVDSSGLIPSGIYTVVVTDTKDCKDTATYTIIDPPSLRPNLPSLVTICSNQTYEADAGMPNATYLWFSPNGFTSSSRTPTLSTPGVYYLMVTNSKGCSGKDTLTLVKSSGIIDANFIMAEKASVGDTIVLIEMSWPVPQSIEWSYPASFNPIYHTDYSIYLVPRVVGKYNIGLTSYVEACTEYIEKVIIVEPSKGKGKGSVSKQPIIKGVAAYPNPNRGDFSVDVELNVEADVMVEVYSVYGQKLLSKQGKGLTKYKVDINLFQAPGIYLVRISAGSEFRSLRVVVK